MRGKGGIAGRVPQAEPGSRPTDRAPAGLAAPRVDPSRVLHGDVLSPRGCDDEVAAIMDRLDRLQSWLVLQCTSQRGDPDFMSAATLVQDTRVLIVERCFKGVPR